MTAPATAASRPGTRLPAPTGPAADPSRTYTPEQQATGKHLIDVHDALRSELEQLRNLVAQIGSGNVDPTEVRSFMNRMTIRQNNWTLGVYCATYCRVVTGHHTLEDRSVFPHLKGQDPDLDPVIDRLAAEHEVIADLLERIDKALVALVESQPEAMKEVRAAVDLLDGRNGLPPLLRGARTGGTPSQIRLLLSPARLWTRPTQVEQPRTEAVSDQA